MKKNYFGSFDFETVSNNTNGKLQIYSYCIVITDENN